MTHTLGMLRGALPADDPEHPASYRQRLGARLHRFIEIADEPSDDDDLRLRKRVGVIVGYTAVIAPLGLPYFQGRMAALAGALALAAISIGNLALLARTRRFERYVTIIVLAGTAFTMFVDLVLGGIAGSSAVIVWASLWPAYALLTLGARRAVPWFLLFVAVLAGVILLDPFVSRAAPPAGVVQLLFYGPNIGVPAAIIFLMLRYTDLRRREAQARSDELLANALPLSIAARLKHGEDHIAEAYVETTVLFADIVGFTPWAQRTDPARVVGLLDALFSRFDELATEYGVEKIKTIGDAYMAVAGAPESRTDHAEAAVSLGRAILRAVAAWRTANALGLEVRIGLASGKVVAGVIGQKRILFDLWGDTVNTASRMESSGVASRIQVASSTWELLRGAHAFEQRHVEAKGLGEMTAYLLVEPAPTTG
jgi:adenylate cyclase